MTKGDALNATTLVAFLINSIQTLEHLVSLTISKCCSLSRCGHQLKELLVLPLYIRFFLNDALQCSVQGHVFLYSVFHCCFFHVTLYLFIPLALRRVIYSPVL